MKKIFVILLIAVLLFATISVSGCTLPGASTIKTQQEAGEAIKDVSGDVGEVTDTLQEIEQTLG